MADNKSSDFLNYINKPLGKDNINRLYARNNVIYERSIVYQDFILSLIDLIFETYLGDDITDDDQKIKHFDWCWNKTIENFRLEGINLYPNGDLYEYFVNFMIETFYIAKVKSDITQINILKLWGYLFDYTTQKSRSDVDTFIEVYQLFDDSIKKMQKNTV